MKKFLRILLLFVVVLIILSMIFFKQVFYLKYEAPEVSSANGDFYSEIVDKINASFLDIISGTKQIKLDENFINQQLKNKLEKEDNYRISQKGFTFEVKNLWVNINEDYLYFFGNLCLNNKHYSSVKLVLTLSKENDYIIIKFEKAEVGKLNLSGKQAFALITYFLDEKYDFGEFDKSNQSFKLSVDYINEQIANYVHVDIFLLDDIVLGNKELIMTFLINKKFFQ